MGRRWHDLHRTRAWDRASLGQGYRWGRATSLDSTQLITEEPTLSQSLRQSKTSFLTEGKRHSAEGFTSPSLRMHKCGSNVLR